MVSFTTSLVSLCLVSIFYVMNAAPMGSKSYIIQMEKNATHLDAMGKRAWYSELVDGAKRVMVDDDQSDDGMDCMQYVYHHAFNGFSARLTSKQAKYMAMLAGVLRVSPDKMHTVSHTTRSPDFVGLTGHASIPQGYHLPGRLWQESDYGEDMIIGIFDSGIWPERMSFNDDGMGPIPRRWKGECQTGPSFTKANCNKKIIGAKFFLANASAIDEIEYQSPRDSLGHGTHTASIAAGRAVTNANYNGTANGTARGMAPNARIVVYKVGWQLKNDIGRAIALFSDLIAAYEEAILDGVDVISLSFGEPIVQEIGDYLLREDGIAVYYAVKNGIFVSVSAGNSNPSLPGLIANVAPWYMTVASTTQDREVDMNRHDTSYNLTSAPKVAFDSSQGPIPSGHGQWLKPDVAALGVQILAAGINDVEFVFLSGTSMSCPHVSGFAALLRAVHRDWSLAAVRSALMTTTTIVMNSNQPILRQNAIDQASPWDFGAGFVLPNRAMDPGLIYDMKSEDYLFFLCGMGLNSSLVQLIDADLTNCPQSPSSRIEDINFPAFVANFEDIDALSSVPRPKISFRRFLTSVGIDAGRYLASVDMQPAGFEVSVEPSTLMFNGEWDEKMFTLTVTPSDVSSSGPTNQAYGRVLWSDGVHNVSSPIVVMVGYFGPPNN